jgi:hypothetical protein
MGRAEFDSEIASSGYGRRSVSIACNGRGVEAGAQALHFGGEYLPLKSPLEFPNRNS